MGMGNSELFDRIMDKEEPYKTTGWGEAGPVYEKKIESPYGPSRGMKHERWLNLLKKAVKDEDLWTINCLSSGDHVPDELTIKEVQKIYNDVFKECGKDYYANEYLTLFVKNSDEPDNLDVKKMTSFHKIFNAEEKEKKEFEKIMEKHKEKYANEFYSKLSFDREEKSKFLTKLLYTSFSYVDKLELTVNELCYFYEVNCWGYDNNDVDINYKLSLRDTTADLNKIFNEIKYLDNNLTLKKLKCAKGLVLPLYIDGHLILNALTTVEGLDLSNTIIMRSIYLENLTSHECIGLDIKEIIYTEDFELPIKEKLKHYIYFSDTSMTVEEFRDFQKTYLKGNSIENQKVKSLKYSSNNYR